MPTDQETRAALEQLVDLAEVADAAWLPARDTDRSMAAAKHHEVAAWVAGSLANAAAFVSVVSAFMAASEQLIAERVGPDDDGNAPLPGEYLDSVLVMLRRRIGSP